MAEQRRREKTHTPQMGKLKGSNFYYFQGNVGDHDQHQSLKEMHCTPRKISSNLQNSMQSALVELTTNWVREPRPGIRLSMPQFCHL